MAHLQYQLFWFGFFGSEKTAMTTERGRKIQLVWLGVAGLGLFMGLCSVFALVVTVAQGWQEHAQGQWPKATALVQRCGVDIYTNKPEAYWIDCRISYLVDAEEIVTEVHSRSTPAPRRVIAQYPAMQVALMQDWVDAHPQGTPIPVHYDPANHKKAVLVANRHAAGRTTHAVQLEAAGSRGGKLRIAAGDCPNHKIIIRRAWPLMQSHRGHRFCA